MMTFINGELAGSRYHNANCGAHFNEYVQRTRKTDFDYDPHIGGCTSHDDLWNGRRLKIKLHSDANVKWREAKVLDWTEYLMGPFAPEAHWGVRIAFTDVDQDKGGEFGLGDVVEIHGLKGSPQHNGAVGSILSGPDTNNAGRYGVQYGDNDPLAVKPMNLRRVEELTLSVHRCNVEGGGIFILGSRQKRPFGAGDKLSFEWLDAAVPKVNLAEDPWHVVCPTCRKSTSSDEIHKAEADACDGTKRNNLAAEVECPVCLETKECQTLPTCSHRICSSCLLGWRKRPDGSPFFRPEDVTVDLTEDEIKSELEKNTRELNIPPNRGDQNYMERLGAIFNEVGEMTENGDPESTSSFKRWLVTTPIEFWGPQNYIKYLCQCLGIEAAEVLITYVDSLRGTEHYKKFANAVIVESKKFGTDEVRLSGIPADKEELFLENSDNFHDMQMLHLTEIIAVKYERHQEYRDAIRWYKKNMQHIPSWLEDRTYGCSLNNLALAQKRAGLLQTALKNYDEAIESGATPAEENRQRLRDEINEWIGTSGHATPRLDE